MGQGVGGLLELFLAPPGLTLWLGLAGVWLLYRGRRRRLGLGLVGGGLALLFLCSTPFVAEGLLSLLQSDAALDAAVLDRDRAQAIIVLGAGRRHDAPEYGGDTLNALALERLRYGAWLARRMDLPLLVSGGLAKAGRPAEAVLMKEVAEREFGVAVRWLEAESRNTYENAQFSTRILHAAQVERAFLVTHAWHMPRAVWSFRRAGMMLVPAPTAFEHWGDGAVMVKDFLPSARALQKSAYAFHEIVGYIWYRLRY